MESLCTRFNAVWNEGMVSVWTTNCLAGASDAWEQQIQTRRRLVVLFAMIFESGRWSRRIRGPRCPPDLVRFSSGWGRGTWQWECLEELIPCLYFDSFAA